MRESAGVARADPRPAGHPLKDTDTLSGRIGTMASIDDINEPAVRTVVTAINAGDREGFFAALTSDATLSDDGAEQDLTQWVDQEIFSANGHMDQVVSVSDGGRSVVADYRNDTYGQMRTAWTFTVTGEKVSRIEAGQA